MAEVQPDTVLTFGPDGMTGHDDHKAVCRWATAAFEAVGSRRRGARLRDEHARVAGASSASRWTGSTCSWAPSRRARRADEQLFHLLLEGELLETKLAAIRSMTSQVEPLIAGLGEDFFRDGMVEEAFRRP